MVYNPVRDSLHISNVNTPFKTFVSLVTVVALLWPLNDSVDITLKFCSFKAHSLKKGYSIPCLRFGFLSLGTIDV